MHHVKKRIENTEGNYLREIEEISDQIDQVICTKFVEAQFLKKCSKKVKLTLFISGATMSLWISVRVIGISTYFKLIYYIMAHGIFKVSWLSLRLFI